MSDQAYLSVASSAVNHLCEDLSSQVYSVYYAVDHGAPWTTVESALSNARRLLDQLTAQHNDFERAVEQRYEAEIAAAEKEP